MLSWELEWGSQCTGNICMVVTSFICCAMCITEKGKGEKFLILSAALKSTGMKWELQNKWLTLSIQA